MLSNERERCLSRVFVVLKRPGQERRALDVPTDVGTRGHRSRMRTAKKWPLTWCFRERMTGIEPAFSAWEALRG